MKTYPFQRVPPEMISWSAVSWYEGEALVSFDKDLLSNEHTYSAVIVATIDPGFWDLSGFENLQIVMTAFCSLTHYRQVRHVEFSQGQQEVVCRIELPGQFLYGGIEVEAVLLGDGMTGLDQEPVKFARLASSGVMTSRFLAKDVGLQTKVSNFAKLGWPLIPWKIELGQTSIEDDFASLIQVHVNSQTDVPATLESGKKSFELWQLAVDVMTATTRHMAGLVESEYGAGFATHPEIEAHLMQVTTEAPASLCAAVGEYAATINVSLKDLLVLAAEPKFSLNFADKMRTIAGVFYDV